MFKIYFNEKKDGKLTQAYIVTPGIVETKTSVIASVSHGKTLRIKQSDVISIERPVVTTYKVKANGQIIDLSLTAMERWALAEMLSKIGIGEDLDSYIDTLMDGEEVPTEEQRNEIIDCVWENRYNNWREEMNNAYDEIMQGE